MLEAKGKKLRYSKTLWADYGGVRAKEEKDVVSVEGVDEDSYVKILNHFGRVLKLYTFENGEWLDLETGAAPATLDESQAGRVEASAAPAPHTKVPAKPARTAASKKNDAKKSTGPRAKPAGASKTKTSKTGDAKTKANSTAAAKRPAAKALATASGSKKGKADGTTRRKTGVARKTAKN